MSNDLITRKATTIANKYIEVYSKGLLRAFRSINRDALNISIYGLEDFIDKNVPCYQALITAFNDYNIDFSLSGRDENISSIQVEYHLGEAENFISYQVSETSALLRLSSETDIPVGVILVMKIVAAIIANVKTIFKAFILDLDDTLWPGTILEEGFESIQKHLTEDGIEHIRFMKYVNSLAENLGVFVAICSRNDMEVVEQVIKKLDESIFPLKNQIDCIIANDNDKSDNIPLILEQLSVMPNSVIFIDDNIVEREKIRKRIPEIYVPDWHSQNELNNIVQIGCFFDRPEMSLRSRKKKEGLRILNTEKKKNSLPQFDIYFRQDKAHEEARLLYRKSNQFKFSNFVPEETSGDCLSMYYIFSRDDYRDVCAVATYSNEDGHVTVRNWALSCRFFTIGLEETMLLHFITLSDKCDKIYFNYIDSGKNIKVTEFLDRYKDFFKRCDGGICELSVSQELIELLKKNTNLDFHIHD